MAAEADAAGQQAAPALLPALRQQLDQAQAALAATYLANDRAGDLLHARCALVDAALCRLWHSHRPPEGAALIAVGAYGYGELFPASDVDILILAPDTADAASAKEAIAALVGDFWNLGLEIAHSVRSIAECSADAAAEVTVRTALLEARLLAGSRPAFAALQNELARTLDVPQFFRAKLLEQEDRHRRFDGTPFSLEPNIKESPGGLRDLQMIRWLARAAGLGSGWADLESGGLLTSEEHAHLRRSEESLRRLRIHLHLLLKRRDDRLLFDYQSALARRLGFAASANRLASEMLMQDYYRNAKSVSQLNAILLQNIGSALFPKAASRPRRLNARFAVDNDRLDISSDGVFTARPAALLECFLLLQQHAELQGMSARTLRAMFHARHLVDEEFRQSAANRALFLRILQQPHGVWRELRRMNQYGILGRYLPPFGAIIGQMQHDLFHAYTVDQHILNVIGNLRRFEHEEFAHENPFAARLIGDFDRSWLLYVAALFHDIAKGRGGDHAELATEDAAAFCRQHAIAEDDEALIVWLVRHHLKMSLCAQKEDISDPAVIAAFADLVANERRLDALYLLTVADIRGTGPKVWNSWKGELLQNLYNATQSLLRQGSAPVHADVIEQRQARALSLLRYFALPGRVHEGLWKQLDTVYFLRHSADEIAWHTRALHYRTSDEQPVVKARLNPGSEGLQVLVYTRDQRDLFARIVGFFAHTGYTIADARIHTTRHGYALDSFVILATAGRDGGGRDGARAMIGYIEHELAALLRAEATPGAPPTLRQSRRSRHFPIEPQVSIRPDQSGSRFVLSLVAADRPGLLYAVARVLAAHRITLHTARIATLGERVEDVFLISGSALSSGSSRLSIESQLIAACQNASPDEANRAD